MLAHAIRSGQRAGDIRLDIDADRAGLILFDDYLGALFRWVSDEEGRRSFEDELVRMLDLVLAGIALRPSIERTGEPGPPRARRRSAHAE